MSTDDGTQVETEETTEETEEETEATSEETSEKESGLPDDPEELRREIAKLRRENAAKRTKNRETEAAAKKWKEHVDSQKTELEKLQEMKQEMEDELKKLKVEKIQSDLAKEYGVDPDLVEFIVGEDIEEMTEKAKKLAKKTGSKKPTTKDTGAGKRGGEVASKSETAWLRDLLKG